MRFTKMQGLGNDYVYVDCFHERIGDPQALARAVSDRHFGIGSDGLILVLPSRQAHVRMRMFNADGSEAQMCGNGIRCVAKYTYDHNIARTNPLDIETAAGLKRVELTFDQAGKVSAATVDMGEPIFDPVAIPVAIDAERVQDYPIDLAGRRLSMTCVSMGNPHAAIFVDDVESFPLEQIGPMLENHKLFPQRINAHFVQVLSRQGVRIRTWERGSGVTLSCGTGAAGVCAAGAITGRTDRRITAHLPGGRLELDWRNDGHVYMTGSAVEVFSGDWPT